MSPCGNLLDRATQVPAASALLYGYPVIRSLCRAELIPSCPTPAVATLAPSPSPNLPLSDRPEFRIAAIDVGSNSIHMVVAQADADGGLTTSGG